MLRDLSALTASGAGICGTPLVGVLASDLPTGFANPGLLNNDVDSGDPAGTLYRVQILSWPSAGALQVDENGAFSFTGAPDGVYSGAERVYKFGASGLISAEDTTYELAIGTAALVGSASAQNNSTSTASVSQNRILVGTGTSQTNTVSAGAVAIVGVLAGAGTTQSANSSSGVAGQVPVSPQPDTDEPITLDQAKQHLRVTLPDDDDYIQGLITAARQMVEDNTNRTLVRRQRRIAFDMCDRAYYLRKPPLVSVDSAVLIDEDGTETLVDGSQYRVATYSEPAQLLCMRTASWGRQVAAGAILSVSYTAGYAPGEVPAPLIQWMLLVIGTMYENRETMSVGAQVFSIPEDFMKMLWQPYMVYE